MSDEREVLSALIDREPVDPDVLARVLEDPSNRALLVHFVRVRALVQQDEPDDVGPRQPTLRALAGGGSDRGWIRAAAMFLLLGLGLAGGAGIERYASRDRPPEPARVVQFDVVAAAQ